MIVAWPKTWPLYKQGCFGSWDDACDIVVGPCSCAAWHKKGEFTFRKGVLRRYGKEVAVRDTSSGLVIYQYWDRDNVLGKSFYKLEYEGKFLGSFEDPEGLSKCQCFIMGWRLAREEPCTRGFLRSIPMKSVTLETI